MKRYFSLILAIAATVSAQIVPSTGNVRGPTSATDNAVARYDGTTGKLIQNSGVTIDDSGNLTVSGGTIGTATLTNLTLAGGSSGASLVLGQGTNGAASLTTSGTGVFNFQNAAPELRLVNSNTNVANGLYYYSGGTLDGSITVLPATAKMTFSIGRSVGWGGDMDFVVDTVSVGTVNPSGWSLGGNLTVSGTVTPTGGIVGTTTNNNATAGNVGEYVELAVLRANVVSLTTATGTNLGSINITAGDWDVSAHVMYKIGGGTTYTTLIGGPASSSGGIPNIENGARGVWTGSVTGGTDTSTQSGIVRYSVSGSTSIYLTAYAEFSGSTLEAYGVLRARRVR